MVVHMEKISIGIMGSDNRYSIALGTYLSNYNSCFSVSLFSKNDDLICKSENTDIILISEDLYKKEYRKLRNKLIYLSETRKENHESNKDAVPDCIFKYMKAEKIANEIKYIFGMRSGNESFQNHYNGASVLGFYGACGGVGKTVIAIACARILALAGKKVMYLNYESIASAKAYFDDCRQPNRNISDFVYYLFNKNLKNISSLVGSFAFKDEYGVECFYPPCGINEVKKLTFEENLQLIKTIQEKSGYDYVCIDFSDICDDSNYKLLALCKKIFNVSDTSAVSRSKNTELNIYLEYQKEKIMFPENLSIINKSTEYEKADDGCFIIRYDPESFVNHGGICEIRINGLFGMGIKNITDYIISSDK